MSAIIKPTSSRPTHDSTGNLLPAILCLHGSGSNSTVFKIQSRRLIWALGSQFRFIFAEGPFDGIPGHGMLPVFESCAPFYKWFSYKFTLGEADVEIPPAREVQVVDGVIRNVMEENGGVESFVGVIGFSQGARVVSGLLLRQKMAERDGKECWTKFKFGVCIGGPFPPIAMTEEGEGSVDATRDYPLLREIPTVHAWGDKDFVKEGCVALADLCEGDVSFRQEFEGGHHLPLQDRDARDLCDHILAAWYAGGGKKVVGAAEKY